MKWVLEVNIQTAVAPRKKWQLLQSSTWDQWMQRVCFPMYTINTSPHGCDVFELTHLHSSHALDQVWCLLVQPLPLTVHSVKMRKGKTASPNPVVLLNIFLPSLCATYQKCFRNAFPSPYITVRYSWAIKFLTHLPAQYPDSCISLTHQNIKSLGSWSRWHTNSDAVSNQLSCRCWSCQQDGNLLDFKCAKC